MRPTSCRTSWPATQAEAAVGATVATLGEAINEDAYRELVAALPDDLSRLAL